MSTTDTDPHAADGTTSSNTAGIEAIRKRDEEAIHGDSMEPDHIQAINDRETLLAEVDRLTLATMSENDYLNGQRHERARILAAVEAQAPDGAKTRDFAYALGWDDAIASVIAIVKGETT